MRCVLAQAYKQTKKSKIHHSIKYHISPMYGYGKIRAYIGPVLEKNKIVVQKVYEK